VSQVQRTIARRQGSIDDADADYADRKESATHLLYAAGIAIGAFILVSFIFLAVKIERDLQTIADRVSHT
jgi:hypothetical protein